MRKRIASIVLSVCLCLTLLPTAAFAEENGTCTHASATQQSDGSYICANEECSETLIAEVTKTTENGGTATYYLAETGITDPNSDEDDDLALVQKTFLDSSTTKVKLLADVKTAGHVAGIGFYSPNQTLDLNGHTLDTVGGGIFLMLRSDNDDAPDPSVTIMDSSTQKGGALKGYRVYIYDGTLTIDSGTLTVEKSSGNSSTDTGLITIDGGSMTVSGTAQVDCSTITVEGYTDSNTGVTIPSSLTVQDTAQITGGITVNENGTLTMTGGTVAMHPIEEGTQMNLSTFLYVNGGTAKISGGSIDGLGVASGSVELSGGTYRRISVLTSGASFSSATELLKNGYAYFTKATETSTDYTVPTAPTPSSDVSMIQNVAVKTHKCSFSLNDGTGKYTCDCGRTAAMQPIAYVEEDGNTAYCMEYTEINSSYISTNSSNNCIEMEGDGKWYVVTENINTPKISLSGNSHLILKNNITATLTAGIEGAANKTLTIYGQPTAVPGATGKLVVETTESTEGGIYSKGDLTINGGEITVTVSTSLTASSTPYYRPNGIYSVAVANKLTVNGGSLTVTAPGLTDTESVEVYGVYAGELTVNGGKLTVTSQDITAKNGQVSSCGILTRKLTMTRGDVSATAAAVNVTCNSTEENNVYEGRSEGVVVEGTATGTGVASITSGTLTANGGNVTVTGYAFGMSAQSDGLYASSELSVKNATVTANGGNASLTVNLPSEQASILGSQAVSYGIYAGMTLKSGTVTAKSGTAEVTGCNNARAEAWDLYVDLDMQGGKVTGSVLAYLNSLTMTGGTMTLKENSFLESAEASGNAKLAGLLSDGCAFYEPNSGSSGSFVNLSGLTQVSVAYVKLCTYTAPSGTCPHCGKDFTPAPSSSGGSSSNTTSTTVKNPDGSTTTTVTNKATGTVTETTKNTDGSTTTIETKKDGTVTETNKTATGTTSTTVTDKNGNSTTTVSVSKEDAQSSETITLPVDEVKAADSSENAQEISVEVPSGGATIEVPVKNPTPGTVIVIVDKDGNETVVPTTKQTENGVSVTLTEDATIKVIENSKDFSDVRSSDYFGEAVDWASSRGITGGNSATTFGPHDSCTRAQLVTFLWRAAGQPEAVNESGMSDVAQNSYYTDAVAWAFENGIVGGYGNGLFGSEDTITREQMAVILYRFAQKTGMDTTQGGMAVREYKDYDSISDYALSAMQWAVNTGILQGYNNNLMPGQPCTRAQIVTMLYRLLGE